MQHGPGIHIGGINKKLASFEIAYKSKRQIAEGTFEFTFEKPQDFLFSAGQHIRMTLISPPETDTEGDSRFFTMASTPDESDLKFAWRHRDTAFKRTAAGMQPGQKVLIQKLLGETPKGSFALHEDADRPAVFIAGGIGIVPAYAIIKDALQRQLPHTMYLFYSNRRPEDAPYLAELQTLAKQNPAFKLVATMTEPEKSAQDWKGETGFISRPMLEKHISNLQAPIYYVSGLPEMVSAMKALLAELGISENHIRAEEFKGFNLNALTATASPKRKNHVPFILLGIALIGVVLTHTGVVGSLSHAVKAPSLNDPISFLVIGLLLVLIAFKVLVAIKLKRSLHKKGGNHKLSVRDVIDAHSRTKKN
jgi:ferredoxin-NADP reductase